MRLDRSTTARTLLLALGLPALPAQQVLFAIGNGVGDGSSNLYTISGWDGSAPMAHDIGETGLVLTDIAVHPGDGRIYATDGAGPGSGSSLYRLDPATGAATLIGNMETANQTALEFDVTGRLWAAGAGVFTEVSLVDLATGRATSVVRHGFGTVHDLAFDPDGDLVGCAGAWFVEFDVGNGGTTRTWNTGLHIGEAMEIDNRGVGVSGGNTWDFVSHAWLATHDLSTGSRSGRREVRGASALGLNGLAFAGHRGVQFFGGGTGVQKLQLRWQVPGNGDPLQGWLEVAGLGGTPCDRAVVLVAGTVVTPLALPSGVTLLVDLPSGVVVPLSSGTVSGELSLRELQPILHQVSDLRLQVIALISSSLELQASIGAALRL